MKQEQEVTAAEKLRLYEINPAAMARAIGELERSAEIAEHNEPIHAFAGDWKQAAVCQKQAEACRRAIFQLRIVAMNMGGTVEKPAAKPWQACAGDTAVS